MRLRLLLVLFACLALLPPGMVAAKIVDRIVAQVNEEIITLSELEQAMKYVQANPGAPQPKDNDAFRRQMLDVLIDRKLAKEEAKRYGMTVSDKELQKALDDIKQRNGFADDEALANALAKDGMTLEQLRQQISEQIIQDRLMSVTVKARVKVPEAEARRYYEEHFKGAENRVHIKVISLPVPPGSSDLQQEEIRSQAERILLEAKRGADFNKLAQEQSKPMPGIPSGDLGYVRQGDLDPRFFEFLASLRPGEVVPLKTPQGFQIIKMMDLKMGQARSFEEVRGQIEQILGREETAKLFSEHLKGIRQRAHIKILL
ncbi:MAG: hypothetical protein FJ135_02525 [Deltaproteobacteria bacterium]|nr:hypothetical protein [Deltaproteobacteria bacterium]